VTHGHEDSAQCPEEGSSHPRLPTDASNQQGSTPLWPAATASTGEDAEGQTLMVAHGPGGPKPKKKPKKKVKRPKK